MPPRKSNISQVSEEDGAPGDGIAAPSAAPEKQKKEKVEPWEVGYNLPKTMVQRLAKGVLPPNTQIQKDALMAISKSATVFVNYLTLHANEQAQRMNKKTIQPKDVLDAIVDIEFPFFYERLNAELTKYNAVQCDKRNSYRRKVRDEQKAKQEGEGAATEGATEGDIAAAGAAGVAVGANGVPVITSPRRDGEGEPSAKKVRGEDGMEVDDEEDAPDEVEEEQEDEAEDDQEDDDEDEETFEDAKEELAEDPLEDKQDEEMEDEALDEGHESD